ncbi:hypothetical protein [Bradyrhizobium sp.]|nr:hypothetical protein [Bradyrhizobium sp.]
MRKKLSLETRRKISAKMLGRKRDEKTKTKISRTLRAKWDLIRQLEAANA